VTLTPALKAALLAEIEKALPALLRKATAATKAAAAPKRAAGKRARLPNGAPKSAILKAVKAFQEDGADRHTIKRMAPHFLGGKELSDNTLKRWLFVLKREGEIENINGRWFWQPDGNAYRRRSRDIGRPEDEYQEKDDL
jgi:hypothetical protein